jgi:hypothetical protein
MQPQDSKSTNPGTVDPSADPATLIPAANMGAAAAALAARSKVDPNVQRQIDALQAQLTALAGGIQRNAQPDLVMVNPHGRIVEVTGKMVSEYLAKPGFRKATEEEEANYRKALVRQTPEYLRRRESKRLKAQKAILDEIEKEDEEDDKSIEELQRAPVTNGQLTNAPAPKAAPSKTVTPPADRPPSETGDAAAPRPRSRKAKK